MDVAALLLELYGRIPPIAHEVVTGVEPSALTRPPGPGVNTIAWLVWHLTRVQDSHIAEILDVEQVWVMGDWAARFGLDPDPSDTGYGHTAEQVAGVQPIDGAALLSYLDVVDARTRAMLAELTPADLERVVDRRWNPPVTLGVRLVSIAEDCLQHVGQAAYARGMLDT